MTFLPSRPARPALPLEPLLALVAATALVFAPYVTRVPVWLTLLLGVLLAWRFVLARRGARSAPPVLLLAVLVPVVAGLIGTYGTLLGRDGGTALLLVLIALKLHETHARRDALLVVLLGFFTLTANFFFTQGFLMTLYVLAGAVILTGVAILWQRPGAAPRASARRAAVMLAQAAPLALALFLLFPRPASPLWTMPVSGKAGQTGLADEVSPGSFTRVAQSDAVAFRVDFQSAPPPQAELYWRGPVFEVYDGRAWRQALPDPRAPLIEARGSLVRYAVTLEPHERRWLLALDAPGTIPGDAAVTAQLQVVSSRRVTARRRYELASLTSFYAGRREYPERLRLGLQLPAGGNPRARALAASWATLAPAERVRAGMTFLEQGGFRYTLSPPALQEPDFVDAFLFGTRQGFCEHFAGSFAFLMRAAGVPARVVGGYQGGQANPVGGYWIVRQADAHAWVEVWLDGEGWRRVDPTAAAAPSRVTLGPGASVTDPASLPPLARSDGTWWNVARFRVDAMERSWNDLVVGYDGSRQEAFLARFGVSGVGSSAYVLLLLVTLGIVTVPVAWLLLARTRAVPGDEVQAAYVAFTARLARVGVRRGAAEGAADFAERVARVRPQDAEAVRGITAAYQALRYGRARHPDAVRELWRRVRAFRPRD